MTEALVRGINEQRGATSAQGLHFVCGALIMHDAAKGLNPFRGLDVERVFAAVELLAERSDLEVTPFVSAWHPAVNEWDRPRSSPFFDRELQRALLAKSPTRNA